MIRLAAALCLTSTIAAADPLATGAQGAVGSSFNFAARIYHNVIASFENCEIENARLYQNRSARLISTLARHGYMGAAKATMAMLGVPDGPARLPNASLDDGRKKFLRSELESLGFFDWI